jgi:4-amino-4-deoxy-L-arabinose transferase-like glycosyltransferase
MTRFLPLNKLNLTIPILATFVIAFFLRTYKLEEFPLQINQDELSNLYDGYCIAETGADRWGVNNPLILKAYGDMDNKPPLYTYLISLSVKLFGYSVFSGRLPSALIGCISLILLFLVASKIGNKLYAFFCLIFAALSPWHLIYSRIAHEGAALPPFFIILSLYLWILSKEKRYSLSSIFWLGLVMGIGTNAYHGTKPIFFFMAMLVGIYMFFETDKNYKKTLFLGLAIFIGALPQLIAAYLFPTQFFARANEQLIEFSFSFHYFKTILINYFSNFSPKYLFLSFGEFNNLSIGRLLLVEIVFFYAGLIVFYWQFGRKNNFGILKIYLLIALVVLPAGLTLDSPHALRTSAAILLYPLFSAAALYYLVMKMSRIQFGYLITILVTAIILANGAVNINKYTRSMPMRGQGYQWGQVAMYNGMNKYEKNYDSVQIQLYGAFQYLFVAAYCDITPNEYKTITKKYTTGPWYNFSQLGKYRFLSIDEIKAVNSKPKNGRNLLVLLEKSNNYTLLDSLNIMGERMYYYKN